MYFVKKHFMVMLSNILFLISMELIEIIFYDRHSIAQRLGNLIDVSTV